VADFADGRTSTSGLGATIGLAQSTVTSGTALVSVGGELVTADVLRGITLAVNDPVLVTRSGSKYVVTGILGPSTTTPDDIDTPPPPKPEVVTGRKVITPVYTGTYRDGKWGSSGDPYDTLQGSYGGYGNAIGAAFYGSAPRSLDGATVTRAWIAVKRERAGVFAAQTTTLRLVTQSTKPSGAPTLGSTTTGPRLAVGSTDDMFDIPDSWAQAMVDGTAGGLAIYDSNGSPYVRLAGKGSWGSAWKLTIEWRR
jgi:hypothetical protein